MEERDFNYCYYCSGLLLLMTGSIESGDTLRIFTELRLLYLKVFTFDSRALSLSDTPPYDTYPAIRLLLLYPDAD